MCLHLTIKLDPQEISDAPIDADATLAHYQHAIEHAPEFYARDQIEVVWNGPGAGDEVEVRYADDFRRVGDQLRRDVTADVMRVLRTLKPVLARVEEGVAA
jgi:hypothetical protein